VAEPLDVPIPMDGGFLEEATAGVGGEIQLTDAMNQLAQAQAMCALLWRAKRYDIGNRLEYAKCFLELALRRDDIAAPLREHLGRLLQEEG
jgi:UTP--glucose-1-phosphate uridylyltransferase